MQPPRTDDPDDVVTPSEAVRARLHRLNDTVQGHEGTIREHAVRIEMHAKQLDTLHATTATREQLTSAVSAVTAQIDSKHDLLSTKLENFTQAFREDLAPLKRAVYWVIALIMTGVGLAAMNLILKKPLP